MPNLRCVGGPLDGELRDNQQISWTTCRLERAEVNRASMPYGPDMIMGPTVKVIYHYYEYEQNGGAPVWKYKGEG